MGENYTEKIKEILKKYKKEQIRYGKPLNYLLLRNNATKEELEKGLFDFKYLEFCEMQRRQGEIRYALYFVYSRRRGRVYVIKPTEKELKIITIYPIGKLTLRRYRKKRFKS